MLPVVKINMTGSLDRITPQDHTITLTFVFNAFPQTDVLKQPSNMCFLPLPHKRKSLGERTLFGEEKKSSIVLIEIENNLYVCVCACVYIYIYICK